ncbi:TolC family protein [Rubritalea tangerina]|uniref:TolC family protein n=1 Tax=Rubritalea tangerina TaxID=430798 RepID=A0ABW4ZEY7_9BACT
MTGCQSLPPVPSYQWSDETARASANLQPEILRAERKFSEEKRRENWSTKLAEASRVGVTATSDGGAVPVFSVDLLKLTRADETTEEAAARLNQLKRQHEIAVRAGKRELRTSNAQLRALELEKKALELELKAQQALYAKGDVRESEVASVQAKLARAESALVNAQNARAAKVDALESLTLLERGKLE